MAESESTTVNKPILAPPEPSLVKQIERERDQLSKAFGVCKTLKHALMYSDGDLDINAMCYSDCADAAADIIDRVHAHLEAINNRVLDLTAK